MAAGDGLLRLPHEGGPIRHGLVLGPGRNESCACGGNQAQSGGEAGPWRVTSGGQGHEGDRPDSGRSSGGGRVQSGDTFGLRGGRRDAGLRGEVGRHDRTTDRHKNPRSESTTSGRSWRTSCRRGIGGSTSFPSTGARAGPEPPPLAFSDHVALPFKVGFSRVYRILAEAGIHENVVLMGSGKLGLPANAMVAFALGCDTINVAREAMMAVGCIQAQRCHTGHCPTGVATQNRWLVRGLDPTSKAARLANYVVTLRKEILQLSRASGVAHPGLLSGEMIEILDGRFGSATLYEIFGYRADWGFPSEADRREIVKVMEAGALA